MGDDIMPASAPSQEKEEKTSREQKPRKEEKASKVPDRLKGAFEGAEESKGGWISQERQDVVAREKEAAKKKAFERSVLDAEAEKYKERELQQQQAKRRQVEEEADSSLDLLERLNQQKQREAPEEEPEEVTVDLRTALALKADARPKWLSRACKMAEEGKASKTDLYDILSSRKFVARIPA